MGIRTRGRRKVYSPFPGVRVNRSGMDISSITWPAWWTRPWSVRAWFERTEWKPSR